MGIQTAFDTVVCQLAIPGDRGEHTCCHDSNRHQLAPDYHAPSHFLLCAKLRPRKIL
jgi:hypothetical protein